MILLLVQYRWVGKNVKNITWPCQVGGFPTRIAWQVKIDDGVVSEEGRALGPYVWGRERSIGPTVRWRGSKLSGVRRALPTQVGRGAPYEHCTSTGRQVWVMDDSDDGFDCSGACTQFKHAPPQLLRASGCAAPRAHFRAGTSAERSCGLICPQRILQLSFFWRRGECSTNSSSSGSGGGGGGGASIFGGPASTRCS